jgi:hypothetical protein
MLRGATHISVRSRGIRPTEFEYFVPGDVFRGLALTARPVAAFADYQFAGSHSVRGSTNSVLQSAIVKDCT